MKWIKMVYSDTKLMKPKAIQWKIMLFQSKSTGNCLLSNHFWTLWLFCAVHLHSHGRPVLLARLSTSALTVHFDRRVYGLDRPLSTRLSVKTSWKDSKQIQIGSFLECSHLERPCQNTFYIGIKFREKSKKHSKNFQKSENIFFEKNRKKN